MTIVDNVPIQIVNGTNGLVIQTEDPTITLITLVATIILAGAAIAGVFISLWQTKNSNKLTRESNDLLRTEMIARLRPLVSLGSITPKIIQKAAKEYLELKATVSNSGTVTVRNLRLRTGVTDATLIKQIIKAENEIKTETEILNTFLPNQSTGEMLFQFALEDFAKGKKTMVFWFDYKYLAFEETVIQTLLYNEKTKGFDFLSYHSPEDVQDARKLIKSENEHKYIHPPI